MTAGGPAVEQRAAHAVVERLRRRLIAAAAGGDDARVRDLHRRYEKAKRRWHKLVREHEHALRTQRPR